MPISNFNLGFAAGVAIRGVPLVQTHPGKVIWVGNASTSIPDGGVLGSDGNPGTFLRPLATLSAALAKAVASRGDIIFLKPGHAETVSSSTALTLSVAGVAIVGLGSGSLRPTLTLDTATSATINVTAANISISNILVAANFAAIVSAITTTTAKNLSIDSCEFRDLASNLNFVQIVDTNATSNDTDGLSITNCVMNRLGTTASSTVIKMDGTNDRLTFADNYFDNLCVTDGGAMMIIATGKVVTHAKILRNLCNTTGVSSGTAGTLITTDGSTNTGVIVDNYVWNLDATSEILVTASSGFKFAQNFSSAVADKSGYILPAVDS